MIIWSETPIHVVERTLRRILHTKTLRTKSLTTWKIISLLRTWFGTDKNMDRNSQVQTRSHSFGPMAAFLARGSKFKAPLCGWTWFGELAPLEMRYAKSSNQIAAFSQLFSSWVWQNACCSQTQSINKHIFHLRQNLGCMHYFKGPLFF